MDPLTYVQEFNGHVNRKNGEELARLLTYQHREHSQSCYSEKSIAKQIGSPWNDLCAFHLKTCEHLQQCAFVAAFKEHGNLVQCFTKTVSLMTNANWMLPVLNVLIRDLRQLAIAADLETSISKDDKHVHKPHTNLESAAELMMGLFRVTATNRGALETSKRKSMINVINQLFKIYFKINKLNLCKPLVRALENAKIPPEHFSLAERVTYNYFLGMKYMFDSDYRMAEELLSFSFRNCHPESIKNKRLILSFLIPVKMLLGTMPSVKLLRQFDLTHFEELASAIKQGNLRKLDRAIELNSEFFWKYGTYSILEKLRMIAYRNLFKKVMLLCGTHQLPVAQLRKALNFLQDEEVTTEEVHCILANLISDGRIKGYISLQHQKLVISKLDPFPSLASL